MRTIMIAAELQNKLYILKNIIQDYSPVAVAFSGGVDSTFLLKLAHDCLGGNATAVTAAAPNFAPDEIADAIGFCKSEAIRHLIVYLGDSFLGILEDNPLNRCYICKGHIFKTLRAHPELIGMRLIDGTNADDTLDFRPGEKALRELGVKSPLKEAGLSKGEIRAALRDMGLPVWNKPAFACLASRIPYGEKITYEKLNSIYSLEKTLRESGFSQVRVRHHGDTARIEVMPGERNRFFDTDFMDKINEAAKGAGFVYAALDLGGYSMGSLNPSEKGGLT